MIPRDPAGGGHRQGRRGLRPPPTGTPLDRSWRRRQWRLQSAHDDWGLHPDAGDPRAPIRQAAGLARLHRQSVRDLIQAHRRLTAATSTPPARLRELTRRIADAYAAYRSAIGDLAAAIAAFDARNTAFGRQGGESAEVIGATGSEAGGLWRRGAPMFPPPDRPAG